MVVGTAGAEAGSAGAGPAANDRHDRGRVFTYVPPPPDLYHRREPYFYGRERIEVPGAVTVNTPPYACSLDGRTFPDRATFVTHLKTEHRAVLAGSRDPFVVAEDGQVRFVPE